MENFDEKSCGVVLFHSNEEGERSYLVLKYPEGHYSFIKGHVELTDSSEEETAFREMEEETGIKDAVIIDGYRESISYNYLRKGQPSNKQVVYFLAQSFENEVKLSHEHHEFVWLNYEETLQKVTFENDKVVLKKAEEFLHTHII